MEKRIRVIVADDEPDIVWLVETLLLADGRFEVVGKAHDGRSATNLACAEQPDVAVLDVGMPLMSGVEAAERIAECAPDCKIVFYSMYAPESAREKHHRFVRKIETPLSLLAALVD